MNGVRNLLVILLSVTMFRYANGMEGTGEGGGSGIQQPLVSLPMGGETIVGKFVPPADEISFKFWIKDIDKVVTLHWADFTAEQVTYIRKKLGLKTGTDGEIAFGHEIQARKITLNDGRTFIGVEHPENYPESDVFLLMTRDAPRLSIPKDQIYKDETVTVLESEIYTPRQIYERELRRRGDIKDAEGHLEMARLCLRWKLPEEGLDHLERAEVLNEAYKDDVLRKELEDLLESEAEDSQNDRIMAAYRGGNYAAALSLIEQYLRVFPDSPRASYMSHLYTDAGEQLKKSRGDTVVVQMYRKLDVIISHKLSKKVFLGSSVKGVRIYTNRGVYEGLLQDANEEEITLETADGGILVIKKSVIRKTEEDVEIGEGEQEELSLKELSRWIQSGECEQELIAYVADMVGLTEEQVKELWDSRLESIVEIGPGGAKRIKKRKVMKQVANWDSGSWLRPGTKLVKPKTPGGKNVSRNVRNSLRKTNRLPRAEEWWKQQNSQTKKNVLESMAAETFYDVIEIKKVPCENCGGRGYVSDVIDKVQVQKRCPICLGAGVNFKVIYR